MSGDTTVFQKTVSSADAHSSMILDGATYVAIAFQTALNASFGSDEAAKWISPETLFWLKTWGSAVVAALLALKLFRSTSFASHLDAKTAENQRPDPLKPQ